MNLPEREVLLVSISEMNRRIAEAVAAERDALRQRAEAAEAALAKMRAFYRWRPISEIHEDYGDCVLINVADVGDIDIGSNLDLGFDISRWTHFSRITPLSGDDYDRMIVEAMAEPKP